MKDHDRLPQSAAVPLLLAALVLILAACQQPPSQPAAATRTVPAASTATHTPTPIVIPTQSPGPTPTATPEPLAEPDRNLAESLSAKGKSLFGTSDLTGAEAAYIDAIAADPSYLPAHLGLTDVYLYQSQYWQQALQSAQNATTLAPEDSTALAYLAWAKQGAHHFDEAKELGLRAVELDGENPTAHTALADILVSMYEVDRAYDHAETAVRLNPESAAGWATLGSIAYQMHDWDKAGEAYERALELEPEFFAWHIINARHEFNVFGDIYAARSIAKRAIELVADHASTLFFEADMAAEEGDWETSEAKCMQTIALDQPHTPFPDAYSCMALMLLQQERNAETAAYQALAEERATVHRRDVTLIRMRLLNDQELCTESRALAEDWLEARPYSISAMRMVGVSYLCERDFTTAATYFRKTLDALPQSVSDARLLAVAYARDGKALEARSVLNEVRAFSIDDPIYYQALYETHLILGELEEAVLAAQRWDVLRPESLDARESLAFVQLFEGNIEAAQSIALDALERGARTSTVLAVLGETYTRMGEFDKAQPLLEEAIELNRDHFVARQALALLFLAQVRCQEAEPHLNWLIDEADDDEDKEQLADVLERCEKRAAQPTPDPSLQLENDEAISTAVTILQEADVEIRYLDVEENEEGQRTLVVAYAVDLAVDSEAYSNLERQLIFELSRILPRMTSEPDGLVVVAGTFNRTTSATLVATRAAEVWIEGELTDEEFENTWRRQEVERSDE
ncbi:MAG: tetratricopeptide repeat protein [Caldilineaceae bacterium SB0661_bin_32]|uniref:Tetratricopeptide repeat protein n=1 Tax=Caldilineaceae bacterium SB0661_bin_32 TaxID=2605255 RepID=A0A6B1D578_9CHLR|nr:tetratricopeptide repeat protein [Caldilineaceae bacterium SB0661_bin_32]